jgi:hypothetical protein
MLLKVRICICTILFCPLLLSNWPLGAPVVGVWRGSTVEYACE